MMLKVSIKDHYQKNLIMNNIFFITIGKRVATIIKIILIFNNRCARDC